MKLETDESGAQVGRFYRGGKEVRFDGLVETRSVYSKDEVVAADDDVVVESEKILEPELNGKNDAAVLEVKKPEEVEKIVQPEPSKDVAPASTSTKTPEKAKPADLFKVVEPRPLETSQEVAVYLSHVETVDMVWVSRLEEEEAIQALMANLTELQETLTKATRKKAGAVFGAVYSDDGELYRAVLKDKAGPGKVTIHYMDFGNSDVVPVEALMNLPAHLAVVPAYAIPVHFSSGLEASPENLDLVRTTLDVGNLTVTVVDGKGHFKIDGREVFGNPALAQVAEVEHDQSPVLVKPQEQEVPAEAVEIPKKEEPKPDENIEEEIAAAPPVVKDLIKKFSVQSPQEGEVESGAGGAPGPTIAVGQTDLVQPQKSQKIPNIVQVVREQTSPVKSRPLENGVIEPVAVSERKIKSWVKGEAVVAKFPGTGWKTAVVVECDQDGVLISTKLGAASFLVDHADVKSSCLPTDALNLLERDLNRNVRQVSEEAATSGLASRVTNKEKVNSWIDGNRLSTSRLKTLQTLPASSELGKYSTTSSGSRHLQAVIATGNVELNR